MIHFYRILLTAASITFLSGCAAMIAPSAAQRAAADYGTYPANYKDIVQAHLRTTLFDPYSVQDLQISTPQQYWQQEAPIAGGRTIYGYLVSYSLNAKNRFGAYVGTQRRNIIIRNGQVVKQWTEGETVF